MIGFELSETQKSWQAKARTFADQEIRPVSWKIDKGLIQDYPWPLIKKLNDKGLLSLGVPEIYGGSGLDLVTTAVVLEELAVADGGISFTSSLNSYNSFMIAGTDAQKETFLPQVCNKDDPGLAVFALTEPNAGSDAGAISTTARVDGDSYVLNGEKCFISNAGLACVYTVFATLDRTKGVKGITAFIVPKDAQGLSFGKIEDKMGFRSSRTASFSLQDVRIPRSNRLGKEGEGFKIAMQELDVLRVLSCGAVGVGIGRAACEDAVRFFKTKGNVKTIMNQQAITFDLADMTAAVEAARLMVWKSCWKMDQGVSASLDSSLTKFFASDMAVDVAGKALRLLGHFAYTESYPIEKYVRDAKILQIYEGTNQVARLVASRMILA